MSTGLEAAWAETVDALADDQRLVLWQDRGGPQWVQVLAPAEPVCEHDDTEMKPVKARLAAYPSKGLGDLEAELRDLAAELRSSVPDDGPTSPAPLRGAELGPSSGVEGRLGLRGQSPR